MMNLLKFWTVILLTLLNSTPVQNFTAVGRLRRLKETKMWQNRDLGLDPGLNSPEQSEHFALSGTTQIVAKQRGIYIYFKSR